MKSHTFCLGRSSFAVGKLHSLLREEAPAQVTDWCNRSLIFEDGGKFHITIYTAFVPNLMKVIFRWTEPEIASLRGVAS